MDKEKEALKFFQDKKEYNRILSRIFEKYKRLGKFSGVFELKDLTKEEQSILAPLNYKYFTAKEAKVSVKKFVEYFCSGKFQGIDFQKVLAMYFKDDLITYREEKEDNKRKRDGFFNQILLENKGLKSEVWIKEMLESKGFGYNIINKNYQVYNKDNKSDEFKKILNNVFKAFDTLTFNSENSKSLPIFSSRVTKDPHYFDLNTTAGKVLMYGICYKLKREYPKNAEDTAELLYAAGILKDDISSFIATFGLKAYKENNELGFIYGFTDIEEPLTFTLGNLSKIDKFICSKNRLFIFENPSLFSEVIKKTANLKPSIICTSGQLKLASLVLLDKVIENVEEIYYSGDFDPEGIFIANKLRKRYGDKLRFWKFGVEDYLKVMSDKEIPCSRRSMLDNIENSELAPLIEKLKAKGLAGYQELLIEGYVEDIRSIME